MGPHLREVVPDTDVQRDLDRWAELVPRFREAWLALEWRLARDPEIGLRYTGSKEHVRIYKQAGFPSFGSPTITVIFVVSDHQVQIKSVKVYLGDTELQGARAH